MGSATLSMILASTEEMSTFCDVAMTYRELTRRRGTPLTLKGPVTRRTPWSRDLRRTTRLPRNRPASRIRMVPGWREARGAQGRMALRTCSDRVSTPRNSVASFPCNSAPCPPSPIESSRMQSSLYFSCYRMPLGMWCESNRGSPKSTRRAALSNPQHRPP